MKYFLSTPLHIAAGEGHNDACDFLRKKMQEQSDRRVDPIGIDAPVDLNGTTPVGWAAVRTRYVRDNVICYHFFTCSLLDFNVHI